MGNLTLYFEIEVLCIDDILHESIMHGSIPGQF